jgi:hypothetical protein
MLYFCTGNGHNPLIKHSSKPVFHVAGSGCLWTLQETCEEVVGEEGMHGILGV